MPFAGFPSLKRIVCPTPQTARLSACESTSMTTYAGGSKRKGGQPATPAQKLGDPVRCSCLLRPRRRTWSRWCSEVEIAAVLAGVGLCRDVQPGALYPDRRTGAASWKLDRVLPGGRAFEGQSDGQRADDQKFARLVIRTAGLQKLVSAIICDYITAYISTSSRCKKFVSDSRKRTYRPTQPLGRTIRGLPSTPPNRTPFCL